MNKLHGVIIFLIIILAGLTVLLLQQNKINKQLNEAVAAEYQIHYDSFSMHSRFLIENLDTMIQNYSLLEKQILEEKAQQIYNSSIILNHEIKSGYSSMINFYHYSGAFPLYHDIAETMLTLKEDLSESKIEKNLDLIFLFKNNVKMMLQLHNTILYVFYFEGDVDDFLNSISSAHLIDLNHLKDMKQYSSERLHRRDYSLIPDELKEYFEAVYRSFD